jgi:hypothetical protein
MSNDQKNVDQRVTSHHQSGGITAHTVNIDTRIRRTLQAEMKANLLRDLPSDRPVVVFGMNGNTESMAFANEVYNFLKENVYQMKDRAASWHMFFEPPVFNIKISRGNGGTERWIVVGPAE